MTSLVEVAVQRIQYHRYGGPEVMRLEEFEPARPGSGEILVRVRAAAANPMDWGIRGGALKMVTGRRFPRGIGYDFAGVVEAVGEGVTRLAVGDDVLGGASIKASGAFAEMVLAEERGVVKKPANLSYEAAAALPTVGLTAFQAMTRNGKLRPGQAVSAGPLPGLGAPARHRGSRGGGARRRRRHTSDADRSHSPARGRHYGTHRTRTQRHTQGRQARHHDQLTVGLTPQELSV